MGSATTSFQEFCSDMSTAIITGAGGLVGAAAVRAFAARVDTVIGIDNDLRAEFFGADASTKWSVEQLTEEVVNFSCVAADIRDHDTIGELFATHSESIDVVIHAAAQPSHDWAASAPLTDFSVNALGTLHLLEATRRYAPSAAFVFCSTNKVYGDTPNALPLTVVGDRYELDASHKWAENGIDESMTIDDSTHSLFGVSKVAADLLVQEYGRYFGMKTVALRGGCLTGPGHSGAQLHGFLAHLMRCAATDTPYTIFGYDGLQVRDNLHANDLAHAMIAYTEQPTSGRAYNIGGGRHSNCSMREAIAICESITGRPMNVSYDATARIGDHQWWISDTRMFADDFGGWQPTYDVVAILEEIYREGRERWGI